MLAFSLRECIFVFHRAKARSRLTLRRHVNIIFEPMGASFFCFANSHLLSIVRIQVCVSSSEGTCALHRSKTHWHVSSSQCGFRFNFANTCSRLIVREARSRFSCSFGTFALNRAKARLCLFVQMPVCHFSFESALASLRA